MKYLDQGEWHSDQIPTSNERNHTPFMCFDESGTLHIAFVAENSGNEEYKTGYIYGTIGQWHEFILDDSYLGPHGTGALPCIGITSTGIAHILYRSSDDQTFMRIYHAWNNTLGGEEWEYEALSSPNDVDMSVTLSFDSDDILHAVLSGKVQEHDDLWFIYYNSMSADGNWSNWEKVNSITNVVMPSIALDQLNNPHIAMMNISGNMYEGDIYYCYKDDSGAWQESEIISDDYFFPTLKIDNDGKARMSCITGGNTGIFGVYHITGDVLTGIKDDFGPERPLSTCILSQNYPNPFNVKTVISYMVPRAGHVELNVFNILGEKVAMLVDEYQEAGDHNLNWDCSQMATGVYFYNLKFDESSVNRKAILLK